MAGLLHQTAANTVLHHVLYIAKGGCSAFEIFTVKKIHVSLLLHLLLPIMFGDTQNLQVCDITLFKARMGPAISHMFNYTRKL